MFTDVLHHLLIAPAAGIDLALSSGLDELIGTMPCLALLAIHQRIAEAADMSAGHPDLRIHQDRALNADIMRILLDEAFPPRFFYIILEFHA